MSIAANVVTHAAKATQLSRISQAPKAQKNTAVPAISPRIDTSSDARHQFLEGSPRPASRRAPGDSDAAVRDWMVR